MARPTQRNKITAAALAVLKRDGLEKLTLDAVADQAKMSKGGLLYHFSGRDALICEIAMQAAGDDAECLVGLAFRLTQKEVDTVVMLRKAIQLLPRDNPLHPLYTAPEAKGEPSHA